jgi:hypothetical protein
MPHEGSFWQKFIDVALSFIKQGTVRLSACFHGGVAEHRACANREMTSTIRLGDTGKPSAACPSRQAFSQALFQTLRTNAWNFQVTFQLGHAS